MSEDLRQVPVPDLGDPLFAPYWAAAAEGRLVARKCRACGTWQWPPRILCRSCASDEIDWVEVPASGRLFSWTVIGHPTAAGYPHVPYAVGIVEIGCDGLLRMVGGIRGIAHDRLSVGLPLRARFVPAGPQSEMTLVQWQPDGEGGLAD